MPVELFVDGQQATTLTSSPGVAATSFTVASSMGFPAASSAAVPPTQFRALAGTEMVTVTNLSGLTWTCLPLIAAHTSGDAVGFELFAAHMQGLQYPQNAARPAGSDYETYPRNSNASSNTANSNGGLWLTAISLPKGLTIGHIAAATATTAASSPFHWWFGLYDSSRVQLALTADQTSAAMPATTSLSLAVATTAVGASSSFTTTYAGLHYIGVMSNAGTFATFLAAYANSTIGALPPILCGASDTGQTTPPAFPHTATAITVSTGLVYATVGP